MREFKVHRLEDKALVLLKSYSSYIERPPHNAKEEHSATFIMRSFRDVRFITFGMNIFLIDHPNLQPYLAKVPRWRIVGEYGFPIIRLEEAYYYLNAEGRKFSLELQKEWNSLTEVAYFYKTYN